MQNNKKVIINEAIRAPELRILGEANENFGVMSKNEALSKARADGKDLIMISENAVPPVAKIMDYGKWRYLEDKKGKGKTGDNSTGGTETKVLRVTVTTGEGDLSVKAKQASEWLADGHRIQIQLQLKGRSNFIDPKFLKERLERILILLTENYKIAEPIKKIPNGMTLVIERGPKKKKDE